MLPVVSFHKNVCMEQLAELSVYFGFAKESDDKSASVDKFLAALEELLNRCGMAGGCDVLDEKDDKKRIGMIYKDSINDSPPKTLSGREIARLLDDIRKVRS